MRAAQPDTFLSFDTYVVADDTLTHPGVIDAGLAGWNGYRWWLAATPYPDATEENPSVWASNDKTTWVVPAGITNPLVTIPTPPAFYSDTHLVLDAGTLYMFYRFVDGDVEQILVKSSTDATTWTAASIVLTLDKTVRRFLSPCVLKVGDEWWMWGIDTVQSGNPVLLYTASTPTGPYAFARRCSLPALHGEPWHFDVKEWDGVYWMLMLYTAPADPQNDSKVHYATSRDGFSWKVNPTPLLGSRQGSGKWDELLYRSSWLPNDELGWDIWYSGFLDGTDEWNVGFTSVPQLDPGFKAPFVEPPPPPPSITETFTQANSSVIAADHTWTHKQGTGSVFNNKFRVDGGAGNCQSVCDTTVGSDDMLVKATYNGVVTDSSQFAGVTARRNSVDLAVYGARIQGNGFLRTFRRAAGGGFTELNLKAVTVTNGTEIAIQVVGSQITVYLDGVQEYTVTDSTHTTGTLGGVDSSGAATLDDWEAQTL